MNKLNGLFSTKRLKFPLVFFMLPLIGSIFLAGCAPLKHYSGPSQSKSRIGLLKTTSSWLSVTESSVEFRKINHKSISKYTHSVELLPGFYDIEVVCYWMREGTLVPRYTGIQLTVLNSRTYQLFSVPRSSGCEVEVEESESIR